MLPAANFSTQRHASYLLMDYNYQRFKPSNYDLAVFNGPHAGEQFVDATLYRLDGRPVRLADYRGRWLVIETGSLTCPMYVKNVRKIAGLRNKYPDVTWLVVYVREAHPGSKIKPHADLDDKIARARQAIDDYRETRDVIVDGVDGTMHQLYGALPNMVYVINPEGTIIYRCDWAFAHLIDDVLAQRDRIHTDEHVQILGTPPWVFGPVTLKAGWDALWDIIAGIPGLFYAHVKSDIKNFFSKRRVAG